MEYVTEVSTTVRTGDLCPSPVRIDGLEYSTLDRGIKWRPSTSRMELPFASIEIDSALTARVDTIFEGIGILSDEGHLCTFSDDDASFLRSEGIIFLHSVFGLKILISRFPARHRDSVPPHREKIYIRRFLRKEW
jgi:hypothetical protein